VRPANQPTIKGVALCHKKVADPCSKPPLRNDEFPASKYCYLSSATCERFLHSFPVTSATERRPNLCSAKIRTLCKLFVITTHVRWVLPRFSWKPSLHCRQWFPSVNPQYVCSFPHISRHVSLLRWQRIYPLLMQPNLCSFKILL
jgi:hypothetical protein